MLKLFIAILLCNFNCQTHVKKYSSKEYSYDINMKF